MALGKQINSNNKKNPSRATYITKRNKNVIKPELHSNATAEKHISGLNNISGLRTYLNILRP